ncbi:VCBS repeat-containing protein [Maribacter antarcticus]|uniref:VCBS repeat-containing protein n=1 Tax=Maribacter antarcticus TaxID=505250 RepID=UPI0006876B70|nr:VCBS repeat-containing protein [Maribacter antarcticus]
MRLSLSILGLTLFLFIGCKTDNAENLEEAYLLDSISPQHPTPSLFSKIDPSYSTLFFANHVKEDLSTSSNLFDFDYFYNGAGVGLEDINNDGLLDIVFCGNQVENRLYLNKGNLVFEDITATSGINIGKIWSNGITFVDINNDGWMDIYISQGGPNMRLSRKNALYINQQDNTFLEQAAAYGLADMGVSTQSAFFDYDKDGDLDCIVMNENEYYGVDPTSLAKLVAKNKESKFFNSSHLYENNNGIFTDITKKAGLERPIFGLGLAVGDLNNDSWPDIYIASDYYIPDALFINKRDGTFEDQVKTRINQISFYGMGIDVADINNDGLEDLFVLDMSSNDHKRSKTLMASMNTQRFDYLTKTLGYQHQYMFNSLQLNTGEGHYNNIAQLTQTARTDWSWSVLISDLDLDADKDIYVTNGYRRYALDNDSQQNVTKAKQQYGRSVPLEVKKELYYNLPTEKLPNIMFEQTSNLHFENSAKDWGLADYTFSSGAGLGDLDNDGDLDLVINNMDETAILYKNNAVELKIGNYLKVELKGTHSEQSAKVQIAYNGTNQLIVPRRVRGYRSSQENTAVFGLGSHDKIDTLRVTWDNGTIEERYGIPLNTTQVFEIADAKPTSEQPTKAPFFSELIESPIRYSHVENDYNDFENEILLPYKQSTLGPFMSVGDVNQDGLDDMFIGGSADSASQLFLATANGFKQIKQPAFEQDKRHEDMESVFFDLDGDKDLDLYVVSGGNEYDESDTFYLDRVYINDGDGNFKKKNITALQPLPKNGKTVATIDIDNDGDKDLLVGNRVIPKNYPKFQASTLYENRNGELVDITQEKAKELESFGIINAIKVTDFDNDGWKDFIVVGEWTTIGMFRNENGSFKNTSSIVTNSKASNKGWWFEVGETDINNDGLKDYLIGNVGRNIKFTASDKKPFKIYAADFDNNGSNDVVLSKRYKGEYVPVRGKECSSQQMPFINSKFGTYAEYANASLVDIYGENLKNAYHAEVTEFNSLLLLNKGNGKFEQQYLPVEAQFLPNLSYSFFDINKDGFEDVIVGGNIYNTEVETPRLDSFSGIVMLSNQKDGYVTMPYSKSGLKINGNIKDLNIIKTTKSATLFATENNGKLKSFLINK